MKFPSRAFARALPLAAVSLLSLGGSASAETIKLDLSDARNESTSTDAPAQSSILNDGEQYIITVRGTGSIWSAGSFTGRGTCGVAEVAPMEPTPGRTNSVAAWDAATVFAAPLGAGIAPFGLACDQVTLPMTTSVSPSGTATTAGFSMATGSTYYRPVPVGGIRTTPRADHTYQFAVTGEGRPARFKFSDTPATDNSGVFTIDIRSAAECAASNCTATSTPTLDQAPPPAGVIVPDAAPQSVAVGGSRTCNTAKVLSVKLKEPRGVDFKRAVFYINGKKRRVATRPALFYLKGKKRGQAKTIKIRSLPNAAITLKIKVTTTKRQRLTITRTIAKCDVAGKKPKSISSKTSTVKKTKKTSKKS